ncbi:hypothetical protein EAO14_01515 [Klebsiella pneumoniae]|nr:hypothetical protein EAO14_01515 [Klebsiella pneumoniae]
MQSGINLKVCKRNGRAGPIVTLKCMEITMANQVMVLLHPIITLFLSLMVFLFVVMSLVVIA